MLEDLTVGWIGLGSMGRPMSQRIHKAGARVLVNRRNQTAVAEMVGGGLQRVTSPRDAAEHADIIILTLFDAASIHAVLTGEEWYRRWPSPRRPLEEAISWLPLERVLQWPTFTIGHSSKKQYGQ